MSKLIDDSKRKNVAILGGTFNPIHFGHIKLAENTMKKLPIDEIWVMPNYKPEYKDNSNIALPEHRLKMVSLAIEDIPNFVLSDLEIRRKGITYTADTLKELQTKYPLNNWYFIMGGDSLKDFHKWYKPEEITKMAHLIVMVRDDMEIGALKKEITKLKKIYPWSSFHILDMDAINISSSEIRQCVKENKDISCFVPDNVARYIQRNNLYI